MGKTISEVNAKEGVEQNICKVCACHVKDAKPYFNKKQSQCQKHLTNARNRERAKEKKEAKECSLPISSSEKFNIDLTDYPDVFKNIKDLAKDQMRSFPHQVIFILKDYFEVAEELIRPKMELILPETGLCAFENCTKPHGFQNDFCPAHSAGGQS